jgi:SAM-dependent methyltransferase
MLSNFKKYLNNSWLFPRYIGIVYVEPVMREVKSLAGGTMLDVGCGTRRYESIFSDVVDDYIGLDWPEIEDRARPDVVGDATKLPLKAACVDVVLATELMEHLPSPHRFLEEVARVLRDDGTLIFRCLSWNRFMRSRGITIALHLSVFATCWISMDFPCRKYGTREGGGLWYWVHLSINPSTIGRHH